MSQNCNLARKYRPKILSDLLGQPSVVRILGNAIKSNKLHQCYLFVGNVGCGKTSSARLLAAMENCLISPGTSPCGKCDNCKRIFAGNHTDVEEIDAASGAGHVEQVRKLKNDAMYNPIDGCKTKYYIIDEAQRLGPASNDALLKLLEEPPSNVRFIMCTTEVQKMRPAVQSRCQRHDFRKIYWSQIAEHLKYVAKNEKVEVDEEAINLCAKLSQGSMRNALQHLEKIISSVDKGKITLQHAEDLFGSIGDMLYYDLFDCIIGKEGTPDASDGFKIINKMLQNGIEFDTVFQGIADHLRNLLVVFTASKAYDFISVSNTAKEKLKNQSRKCKEGGNLKSIFKSIHALNQAKESVLYNISDEIALQTWFVESVVFFKEK